ncbi:tRNA-queuosine alpha-mannosyltransferase domain-containing protein [Candidatus Leptofilum sp.]|uniref:tRNA-queuosine alpha-mannosyltransferase domain-containing protein n=1 Tax=Candidatus Leptofilum sp. TaxID=3241576 RepID=UPI003B59C78E
MVRIDLISPYHGGSHKAWAEGWQHSSRHNITLHTLPDRFWKWRMHGGAITLARRFLAQKSQPDVILATDMLDLTTFLALSRKQTAHVPTAVYMHENQLTYPLPQDGRTGPMRRQLGERDHHYAFINVASMLAADRVFFNSNYHLESFFAALPKFLKHFPEYNELNAIDILSQKSELLPVGVQFGPLANSSVEPTQNRVPLILWNQRWEYDKNPEAFFAALYTVAEAGHPFELALCGQQYGKRPSVFKEAIEKLDSRIVHVGHADFATYRKLLWQADLTISTAHHEFFGISILEAIHCQTFPLLPNRLSYPELLPREFHDACLYDTQEALIAKLTWALTHRDEVQNMAGALATAVSKFSWQRMSPIYDQVMLNLCQNK